VVRVWHVAAVTGGGAAREIEEAGQLVLVLGRAAVHQPGQIEPVHRQDQVKGHKVGVGHAAGAFGQDVGIAPGRGQRHRAPVGRLSRVPVVSAGRIHLQPGRPSALGRPLAQHGTGHRRSADVP